MGFNYGEVPFGLRDVKLTPINANGSYGSPVDLYSSQDFQFTINQTSQKLRGDDSNTAVAGTIDGISWSIGAGGISLSALAVILGVNPVSSGTTPNRTSVIRSKNSDTRPYFRVDGRSIGSEAGGSLIITLFKCRCTGKIGPFELKDGSFIITKLEGEGVDDDIHGLFDLFTQETDAEINVR